MAEKTFKGIVLLNKKQYNEYYELNPVLKDGCPVICVITPEAGVEADSKLMMKVGDGTTAFRSLPWLSGLSADVYDWALQETKPTYTANEIAFSDGENFQQKYDSGELTGPQGETGPSGSSGPAGRGITSIQRTSGTGAPGTTDTYTINYTDSTTSTFTVYNGADGTSLSGDDYFSKSGPELEFTDGVLYLPQQIGFKGTTQLVGTEYIPGSTLNFNSAVIAYSYVHKNFSNSTIDIDASSINIEGASTITFGDNVSLINFPSDTLPYIPTAGGEFSGKIYPSTNNTIDIGDTTHYVKNLYVNNIYMNGDDSYIKSTNDFVFYPNGLSASGIAITSANSAANIIPSTQGVGGYIGSTNYYFNSIHAHSYAFNDKIYLRYVNNTAQIAVIEQFNYVSGTGTGIRFGANQCTAITAGEGATNVMSDEDFNGDEYVVLASDSNIHFLVDCNTYNNKKRCYMSSSAFAPAVNNSINLGAPSQNWTGVYGTTIYTDKIEFSNNDNITYNDTNNHFIFTGDGTKNNSYIECGKLGVFPTTTSYGMGVMVAGGATEVCVVPVNNSYNATNGQGNIGTAAYKWDYVQANHVTGTSDLNIKENMVQFDETYAYESIESLPIYTYKLTDRDTTYYVGTTTQEMPVEMVHLFDGGEGSEYLPNSSIWFLYGAFKEAQRKIKALEEQIQNLTQS